MLIDLIVGARPNFMKIAPIIRAIDALDAQDGSLEYRLIHTGQHYDEQMSGRFFEELGLPHPDINLEVGSDSQAAQTGAIMVGYEGVLKQTRPDLTLVVGDVNSTMACAISARKAGVAVAHVEAGIRSGDMRMPEEINRIVTDSISSHFYITGEHARNHLRKSGVQEDSIHWVGNTMIDTLLHCRPRLRPPLVWHERSLQAKRYIVLTLHRPANVDQSENLLSILNEIVRAAASTPIVFPVHPRTRSVLEHRLRPFDTLVTLPPLGYLEFNYLVEHALGVVTDSGGITEEATVLGVPCMTLRDSTERPETVEIGTNELIGTDPASIGPWLERMCRGEWKTGRIPDRWDGKSGERIVAHLCRLSKRSA